MTDAVVLLALSQLVCLGGLAYLYTQVTKLRSGAVERRLSGRVQPLAVELEMAGDVVREVAREVPQEHRVRHAPVAKSRAAHMDVALIVRQMDELGLDIPTLARRMHRSEDEIRLLLRRQGAA